MSGFKINDNDLVDLCERTRPNDNFRSTFKSIDSNYFYSSLVDVNSFIPIDDERVDSGINISSYYSSPGTYKNASRKGYRPRIANPAWTTYVDGPNRVWLQRTETSLYVVFSNGLVNEYPAYLFPDNIVPYRILFELVGGGGGGGGGAVFANEGKGGGGGAIAYGWVPVRTVSEFGIYKSQDLVFSIGGGGIGGGWEGPSHGTSGVSSTVSLNGSDIIIADGGGRGGHGALGSGVGAGAGGTVTLTSSVYSLIKESGGNGSTEGTGGAVSWSSFYILDQYYAWTSSGGTPYSGAGGGGASRGSGGDNPITGRHGYIGGGGRGGNNGIGTAGAGGNGGNGRVTFFY